MHRTLPSPAIDKELKKNMGKIVSPDFPGYAITKCEDQNCSQFILNNYCYIILGFYDDYISSTYYKTI
jgi:hypothetical protein